MTFDAYLTTSISTELHERPLESGPLQVFFFPPQGSFPGRRRALLALDGVQLVLRHLWL